MKSSKTLIRIFLILVLGIIMLVPSIVNASEMAITTEMVNVSENNFINNYFKDGKLETPEAPYIKETNYENTDTQLAIYYYKTSDLQKLALDIQKQGEEEALKKYGNITQLKTFIQIDAKFDDGEWLSSKGTWDKIDNGGNINYGENIREWDLTFLNVSEDGDNDASKLLHFTQSWLTYFDRSSEFNDYYKPFVKTLKNEYDENYHVFDFTETTIAYRIRWCVTFLQDEYTENQKYVMLTSDWSEETSIGKNGKQEEVKMPEKLDAPKLSKFELKVNEDGGTQANYFVEIPDSIYRAEKYRLITEDGFEPYIIETQVKINDGEWTDEYTANATWLTNGNRSVDISSEKFKQGDNVYIRLRIKDNKTEETTEWSNIIGTKPTGEKKEDTATQKCKLCGICPIQPLDICLFVWIALFIILIIIIVIIINKSKKKKETNPEKVEKGS